MEQGVVTVGLDLAKNVLYIAAGGAVLIRRKLRRSVVIRFFTELSPCLVGMEACASARHWARELMALSHEVRLMPPAMLSYTPSTGKPMQRMPKRSMRFVAAKSVEQQAVLLLPRGQTLHQNEGPFGGQVRASSHAVLREQTEHMDAPDRGPHC